jgi:hypothetical protein
MLEHVALGQSRFMTPGVAPDPRGVLLGRFGLLLFPTLEAVVSWFRLYSSESSLDELIPGLSILRVRTPLRSREMLVRFPATSSYAMDRASRCAGLVGGTTFTGTGKHYVKYRDDRSPYGYDETEIGSLPPAATFMLHGENFTQSYEKEGEIAFDRLLFRLSLRRIPGADRLRADERQDLLLVIARGLGDGVIRYLWRNRVGGEIGLVRPKGQRAFDEHGRSRSYLIARVRELPARILDLFLTTPGIEVFRPVAPNVAVQVGYEHLIDLGSCSSLFDQDSFYVFWGGGGDRVDVVAGPLELSGIEHLTRIDIDLEEPDQNANLEMTKTDAVGVQIRLAPSLSPPRHVVGTLIPRERAAWVKRLVYVMPQTALRGHRVAVTDRGILMVADSEIDVIPLGQLLAELAPGLLVPLGMDLVPRVAPDVLARTLGHGAGVLTVFPHDGAPFQVNEAALVPLERRALARIEVERSTHIDAMVEPLADPSVVNDPVGRFALWGFPLPPKSPE